MKKILVAAATLASLAATPAFAAGASAPGLKFSLDGTVSTFCGVYAAGASSSVPVNFGDLSNTADTDTILKQVQTAYRCNDPAGFTRTVSSANHGKLVRTGSDGGQYNSIGYLFSTLNITDQSLASDITDSFAANGTFLNGGTYAAKFNIQGVYNAPANKNSAPGTTVFAGDYTDTVTITVTGA